MKSLHRSKLRQAGPAIAALAGMRWLGGAATAAIVYFDDFSGVSGSLHGTLPDTTSGSNGGTAGATWLTTTNWNANGTSVGSGGADNAWLPFTPQTGRLYTLSMDADPATGGGAGDWFAIGFVQTATAATTTNSFAVSSVNAAPWMNQRKTPGTQDIETFLGPNNGGEVDHVPFTDASHNLKITLDTTTALWSVKWFVDGTQIRTDTFATNPVITGVGFGRINGVNGTVDNFQLDAVLPEPASFALLVLGSGVLMGGRRRRAGHRAKPVG
jgi:hypothetical protein